MSQFSAVPAHCRQCWRCAYSRNELGVGQDRFQALKQTGLPYIGRCKRALPIRRFIGKCHWLYRSAGFDGRLQERTVESEKVRAIRRGAFGENRDVLAGSQQCVNFGIDDPCVAAAAAAQKHRIDP